MLKKYIKSTTFKINIDNIKKFFIIEYHIQFKFPEVNKLKTKIKF